MPAASALLTAALLTAPAAQPKHDWHRALSQALQAAQERRRPVLLLFQEGDCGMP